MDNLPLNEIAEMGGGTLHGASTPLIRRISRDTRTILPGDLYFSLRGENHDGNLYAGDAAQKGAAAVLIDDPAALKKLPEGYPSILVENSLTALHRLAGAWRDRLAIKAACVTGSSGKTSTKEFTAAVLSVRYRVVRTEGNLNNHIGLPLSILSASTADDAAVWEIGMNHPGEIAPLAALARPDLAIITNIGVAHIEYMGSREAIALEKGMLVEAVGRDGAVILPADDDFAAALAARSKARVIKAGLTSGAVTASDVTMDTEGCHFTLKAAGESVPAWLPTPGLHMVKNALLAVAAGLEFGLSLDECAEGLASARLTGGRLVRRTIRGITLLDDTYNANPDSMEAALITLGTLATGGNRIAVLGRMGELGSYAEAGYRRVGLAAAKTVNTLITVGPETKPLLEAARSAGLKHVHETPDTNEAASFLRELTREGDIVLVKGSRGARMERVIQHFEN